MKQISTEINDLKNKIKEKVSEEDTVSDLIESLDATVQNAAQVLKTLQTISIPL